MHPSVEALLKVQEVDSEIIFLRESLRLRPRELEDDRKKVAETQRALDACVAQSKHAKMESDQREMDVKKADSEITKLQVALNQTKSNQEYAVFKEQIKRQEDLRGKAEEDVIQKLEDIDGLEARRRVLVEKLEVEQKALQKKESEVAGAVQGMQAQLTDLEAQRASLLGGIDKEHLKTYERVLSRHSNFAIARVDGQTCQGCFISVTVQEVNLLMQGQFIQCKSCSRILCLA